MAPGPRPRPGDRGPGLRDRRRGRTAARPRLSSFVALLEVLSAVVFAWLLLGELPGAVQLPGGVLVLGGVVLVKLGEPSVEPPAGSVEP